MSSCDCSSLPGLGTMEFTDRTGCRTYVARSSRRARGSFSFPGLCAASQARFFNAQAADQRGLGSDLATAFSEAATGLYTSARGLPTRGVCATARGTREAPRRRSLRRSAAAWADSGGATGAARRASSCLVVLATTALAADI